MRPTRAAVLAALLAATVHVHAGGAPTRYFDLVNAAHDSVTSLQVAPAGSGTFREIELGAPLRGGLTSITIEIPGDGCAHDFRVVFRDGRALIYRDIDVCRYRQLRLTAKDGRSGPRDQTIAEE